MRYNIRKIKPLKEKMNKKIAKILMTLLILAMVSLPVMAVTYTPAQVLA